MPQEFPPVPDCIKPVSHFLKLADDHESRNPLVTFYARMYSVQHAMKIIPGAKPPEVGILLVAIMDHLEQYKKEHAGIDGITNETVGQALIEEYVLKLYDYALAEDDNERFHKNMIKAFYTVGVLCDILTQFGELSDDMSEKQGFSKQRAAYLHNCLKAGQKPISSKTKVLMAHDVDQDSTFAEAEDGQVPKEDQPTSDDPQGEISWSKGFLAQHKTEQDDSGGFVLPQLPAVPSPSPPTLSPQPWAGATAVGLPALVVANGNTAQLRPEQLEKAQKYCKWAASALNYEDVPTAVENLQKALHLLQTGQDPKE